MIDHQIGQFVLKESSVEINKYRRSMVIQVTNTGERTIQVGSHFHFFEANKALSFDRERAFGMHLDIPSGTAVRFAPGQSRTVGLVEYGGEKVIIGFNGLTNGCAEDGAIREKALGKARDLGFMKEEK